MYEEESDLLDGFFKVINAQITQRKKIFTQLEVSSYEAANAIEKLPLILVFIDNIATLSSSKLGEQLMLNFEHYLKDGVTYGIKYIITCRHLNELNVRARREMHQRICLQMKDVFKLSN